MLDIASMILAGSAVVVPTIGGAFWLSRVEHKASNAAKDLADLETKIIPALTSRLDKMEAHTTDIAVLKSNMERVIVQLEGLTGSMQRLLDAHARSEGRAEGHT